MYNKTKKVIALISAISMLSVATVSNVFAVDTTNDELQYTEFPFIRECEDPEIANGNETWKDIYGQQFEGYSGDGFVYLTGNSIKFEITVPEDAMYEIKVRYTQILSEDGRMQTISVNGSDYMVNFPYTDTWKDISFGMFRLKAGVNTIEIKPQYGYASYDTITVDKAVFPDLNVEPTLADKNATTETQSLMNYLCDVYGNGIISGQQEIYGGGNDGDYELEFDFIENLTGELPAIRGFDFMNYNPLYGWDDNTTERVIEWVNERNGIATGCWHINVPKDFSNYELGDAVDWKECTYKPDETDFDTNNAIVEGTKEYEYFMLAIEDLAEQLLRLQEANVPIILRPLHEAEGNSNIDGSGSWFWWGKGGAETYKELWKLLYTTLTEEYGLHNIIWEYNSYDYTTSAQWYPGDEYVDIVGFDKYNTVYNRHDGLTSGPNVDAISSTFYSLVNLTDAKKLVSMPENDTIPTIENMEVEEARWLYFCPWYGEHILDSSKNDPETVKAIYQDDYCINLADLPENLYSGYTSSGDDKEDPEQTTTTTVTTTEPTETTTSTSYITSTPVLPYDITGTVTEITEDTITVVTDDGTEYVCPISENTVIEDGVEVGSIVEVTAWKYPYKDTIEGASKVSLYAETNDLYGTITAIDGDNITATLEDGTVINFSMKKYLSGYETIQEDMYITINIKLDGKEELENISGSVNYITAMNKTIEFNAVITSIEDNTINFKLTDDGYQSVKSSITLDDVSTYAVYQKIKVLYNIDMKTYTYDFENPASIEKAGDTEFDIPVVLTGTVTEVDTQNDTITVDFTTFTQTIQGYSSNAKVGDTVTAANMSDVIDDEWFETANITIKSAISGETLLGDANLDGNIKVNDVQLIRQTILHLIDPFEEGSQEFINSDVTKDGSIKVNDVQLIRQYILHLIDSFDN